MDKIIERIDYMVSRFPYRPVNKKCEGECKMLTDCQNADQCQLEDMVDWMLGELEEIANELRNGE